MNLPELIENLSLETGLNSTVINKAIIDNYSNSDLVHLIRVFLKGIGNNHQVDGNVVVTLMGINDYYREHEHLTPKQQVYLIQNILTNWNQLGLDMRCQLGL